MENIPNPKAGEITVKDIPLVAYDNDGKIVDVEIVPKKINATITISSPKKEVPIKIIPKNYDKIVFGKAIKNISSDIKKVTIYGDASKLESISSAYLGLASSVTKDLVSPTCPAPEVPLGFAKSDMKASHCSMLMN